MAVSSLFTLLDDIAAVLDDVAVMTKLATKKTAGVIGDDLALNANQVSGKEIKPERELPIVWAVAKGSLWNKAILIPIALLLSIYLPGLINPLLMLGGAYLCFEGVEKLWHQFRHKKESEQIAVQPVSEKEKIKGAIRTDFILSAEIIIIALGVVQHSSTLTKVITLSAIGFGITIFVYGLVGLIVKLDDIGLWLLNKRSTFSQAVGKGLLFAMPWVMKSLSIIGTVAMFLVGGGIFSHSFPVIHHFVESLNMMPIWVTVIDFILGILVGVIVYCVVLPIVKLFRCLG